MPSGSFWRCYVAKISILLDSLPDTYFFNAEGVVKYLIVTEMVSVEKNCHRLLYVWRNPDLATVLSVQRIIQSENEQEERNGILQDWFPDWKHESILTW